MFFPLWAILLAVDGSNRQVAAPICGHKIFESGHHPSFGSKKSSIKQRKIDIGSKELWKRNQQDEYEVGTISETSTTFIHMALVYGPNSAQGRRYLRQKCLPSLRLRRKESMTSADRLMRIRRGEQNAARSNNRGRK